ncbi:MAG: ABC transporter substrate-binding protein [Sphingobacteriales bacterium]|nr:ABC transporter substrate-binding protein [Sphingobacteriales bacterium]
MKNLYSFLRVKPSGFFRRLSFVVILIFLSVSCQQKASEGGKVFRYNQSAGITSLDPAFAKDQANIWPINQIYNGLVQFDDALNLQPCLAKTWQISPDGLTYTFQLRTDVLFHPDACFNDPKLRKMTAHDIVYSFERLNDEKIASPGRWIFNNRIAAQNPFVAPNDSTFVLQLSKPFRPMLSQLAMQYCSVVSKIAATHYGTEFRAHPVGTGPFLFGKWVENEAVILRKNPDYFERDIQGNNLPYIDGVRIEFDNNKRSEYLKFIEGHFHFLSGLDVAWKDELLNASGELKTELTSKIQLLRSPYLNSEYLGFNTASPKPAILGNTKIRQALAYAIDRKTIIETLRNNIGTPAHSGFATPGLPSYNDKAVVGYIFNPSKARQLLAEAGYADGKNLPPLTLDISQNSAELATALQKQWANIGITVKTELHPPALLRTKMAKGE